MVGVLALLGLLVALHRSDAGRRKAPRRDWRPRLSDLAVAAVLGVWWVIGAVTVDDGYIAGIIRSRGENGFIGNVYRWLNAPESPFSWFYDVLYPWSQVSASTLWMRLPATLLGLVAWVLLSRYALPRLGVHTPWLAALAFTTWWVPLNLGLRPGAVGRRRACWCSWRRRAGRRARRRLLPLVGGLLRRGRHHRAHPRRADGVRPVPRRRPGAAGAARPHATCTSLAAGRRAGGRAGVGRAADGVRPEPRRGCWSPPGCDADRRRRAVVRGDRALLRPAGRRLPGLDRAPGRGAGHAAGRGGRAAGGARRRRDRTGPARRRVLASRWRS